MNAETPAEGILKRGEYGDSKFYSVACSCGNDDHAIEFEVEADETGVTVNTWLTQKTDSWTEEFDKRYDIEDQWVQEVEWFWKDFWNGFFRRIRLTYQIWRYGYVEYQSTTVMTEQQALNYAETIKSAITDVKAFRDQRQRNGEIMLKNIEALRKANEGDCV